MESCSINALKIGQKGIVLDLNGDEHIVQRLLEMGVTPGSLVQIIRYAPMGDPVDIKVRGYHLTIRKKEAGVIMVNPQDH